MKRDFNTLYARNEANGFRIGDEAAHRAAAALADRADAPTIIALTDLLAFLEKIGGQCHIVSVRERLDNEGNTVAEGEAGEWTTMGLAFDYETRDLRIEKAKAPETIFGLPVTDSSKPPVQIPVEEIPAESPEDEVLGEEADPLGLGEVADEEQPVSVPE